MPDLFTFSGEPGKSNDFPMLSWPRNTPNFELFCSLATSDNHSTCFELGASWVWGSYLLPDKLAVAKYWSGTDLILLEILGWVHLRAAAVRSTATVILLICFITLKGITVVVSSPGFSSSDGTSVSPLVPSSFPLPYVISEEAFLKGAPGFQEEAFRSCGWRVWSRSLMRRSWGDWACLAWKWW